MFLKKKGRFTAIGVPLSIVCGVLTAMLVTLAGAALTAVLIENQTLGEGGADVSAKVIVALATMLGSAVAALLAKRLRLQVCMLCGGTYFALLLGMTALFFGGQYSGMGITSIIVLAFCLFAAFLPNKSGKKWGGRKKTYR